MVFRSLSKNWSLSETLILGPRTRTAMASKVCRVILSVVLVVGIIFAILGAVAFPVLNVIIHNEIAEQTKLVNGTMGYDIWKNPTADVNMQFWVWNLTNPEEVKAGKKPFLVEKGPYTYREVMLKENITSYSNGTISYAQQKSYILDLNMSVGDPRTEKFTSINIPLMTVAGMYDTLNALQKFIIGKLMKTETTFPSHTVHEMIWGYPDVLMMAAHLQGLAPYSDFGFFVDRNNSNDGIYTVYSGVNKDDTSKINDITMWKGQPNLSFWSTSEANMINGTDGSYNPPFFKKDDTLYVFSSDICRSISAVYEKNTEIRDISTWRYIGPPKVFANATENPDNVGFCTPGPSHCLPSGLLNVSNCQFNAPIVMSLPHFLYCDEARVIDLVSGVKPDKERHQTFFDIEPLTGGPLKVAKRLQINVHLQPFEEFDQIKHLRKLFLPVVWLNESALLTQSGANQLISQVETPILLMTIAKWVVLGLGVLMIILTVTCLTVLWIRRPQETSRQQHVYNSVNPASPGLQVGANNPNVVLVDPSGDAVISTHNEASPLLG